MGYSLDPISDNCYPGTTVLVNHFDIREQGKLNEVESVLTASRIAEWLESPGEIPTIQKMVETMIYPYFAIFIGKTERSFIFNPPLLHNRILCKRPIEHGQPV